MRRILVNQSYWPQRVTGQQRYAVEIAGRLLADPAFGEIRPEGHWAGSALRVWAWVQMVLPARARGRLLLSLTARAPLWRRRHVLVVHDLFVLTHPEWYSRRYVVTHAPLLRAQIRSAAAVVAVSRPVADELARFRTDPVEVAPNAPSAVFTRPTPVSAVLDRVLHERGLVAGRYLLAVGSRDPRKNLTRLAAAYGSLPLDVRLAHPLVVVGGGAGIFRDERLDWPDGTVDAGYVTDEDLCALYRGARSVVFVSLAEGFGLPLVEAAAAGATSLLVSDIAVFRWICGAHARFVDPLSVGAIAEGLREEIADPQQKGIDVQRFDWDASAAVVGEVCRRVVAS